MAVGLVVIVGLLLSACTATGWWYTFISAWGVDDRRYLPSPRCSLRARGAIWGACFLQRPGYLRFHADLRYRGGSGRGAWSNPISGLQHGTSRRARCHSLKASILTANWIRHDHRVRKDVRIWISNIPGAARISPAGTARKPRSGRLRIALKREGSRFWCSTRVNQVVRRPRSTAMVFRSNSSAARYHGYARGDFIEGGNVQVQ